MKKVFHVYILASRSKVLYVGVTGNLRARLRQHRLSPEAHFTRRYNVTRLVHAESFRYIDKAICREKQIKSWRRDKKEHLIEEANPDWQDLAELL